MKIIQLLKRYNTLNIFDWFLIVGIISTNIIYSIISKEIDTIGTTASISGVICVVLVAKGNILNYFFGIINVLLYGYISFKASLYGEVLLNIGYYFPMQFIGFFLWFNRGSLENSVTIKTRYLSLKRRVFIALVAISLIAVGAVVLDYLGDHQPLKDSVTTILSIIAMYLMVKRYLEQWYLWIIVNLVSVVMWSYSLLTGTPHSIMMVLMWLFYLLNSINGLIVWRRLSRGN